MNRLQSSSEDGLDSDQPFDVEMDEEDEEEFDSDERAAEESSLVADEDLVVVEDEASHEVDWIKAKHEVIIDWWTAKRPCASTTRSKRNRTLNDIPQSAPKGNISKPSWLRRAGHADHTGPGSR